MLRLLTLGFPEITLRAVVFSAASTLVLCMPM